MRKLALVLVILGVMGPFASIFQAQELLEGTWTGTAKPPNNSAQKITFELKRNSDPLDRWRLGAGVFLTGTVTVGQNTSPLSDVRLDGENLSYVLTQPNGVQQQCSLTRQKDGSFVGKCARTGGNRAVLDVTMIPPKQATAETVTPPKETTTPKE